MARQKGVTLASVTYMQEKRQNIYIALEDFNFVWDDRDIIDFRKLWQAGYSVELMAAEFDRDPIEIAVLVMDQAERGRIDPRPGGAYGVIS